MHTDNTVCNFLIKEKEEKDMSISKTRQKLVDVARQLFAKNGLENTTMNDIALLSGKGRRTLYTYFKSKEEIYYAASSPACFPFRRIVLYLQSERVLTGTWQTD